MRVDAIDLERRRFDVRVVERQHVVAHRVCTVNHALIVEAQRHGRDLEQRVGLRVEAAGFHVDDDGQKTAEPLDNGVRIAHRERLIGPAIRSTSSACRAAAPACSARRSRSRPPAPGPARLSSCRRSGPCAPSSRLPARNAAGTARPGCGRRCPRSSTATRRPPWIRCRSSKSASIGNGHTRSPLATPLSISSALSSLRFVNTPLYRLVSACTQVPVSVAKSSSRPGFSRPASASVSASTMRPSASV